MNHRADHHLPHRPDVEQHSATTTPGRRGRQCGPVVRHRPRGQARQRHVARTQPGLVRRDDLLVFPFRHHRLPVHQRYHPAFMQVKTSRTLSRRAPTDVVLRVDGRGLASSLSQNGFTLSGTTSRSGQFREAVQRPCQVRRPLQLAALGPAVCNCSHRNRGTSPTRTGTHPRPRPAVTSGWPPGRHGRPGPGASLGSVPSAGSYGNTRPGGSALCLRRCPPHPDAGLIGRRLEAPPSPGSRPNHAFAQNGP